MQVECELCDFEGSTLLTQNLTVLCGFSLDWRQLRHAEDQDTGIGMRKQTFSLSSFQQQQRDAPKLENLYITNI